ncbi:hypothetical protein [Nocardia alni]|uniref:hypothetical protein n=1 Tax=Nocardia alni TaxID=2815723 RepID=UPI001C2357B2|nr:hypothetical protein [Nocardia alni]
MVSVKVVDETTSGDRDAGWTFEVTEERLPLRELIRQRVFQEAAEYNAAADGTFRGLVRPVDAEPVRGGFRTAGRVDPERQCAAALQAFERNGFVVLVGDRQIEGLDQVVALPPGAEVTFLKLIALAGG